MPAFRVTLSSISTLKHWRLILINYFVMPMVSMSLLLLITYPAGQNHLRVVIGSVVMTAISTMIGMVTASFAYDQNIAISDDVLSLRPKFRHYWLIKFVLAGMVSTAEMSLLGLLGLWGLGKWSLFGRFLTSFPFISGLGALLGYISAIAGWGHENSFWLANFLTGSLVILSGVIIPVAQYPFWLGIFAQSLPVSDLLD